MRSILCVIIGFVVLMVVVMAGTATATALIVPDGLIAAAARGPEALPANYYAANVVVSLMAAVLGGWVTARMAPNREMAHVYALAALVLLMSAPGIFGYGDAPEQPDWYVWLLPVLGVGGALLGGWMRARVVVEPETPVGS